MRFGPRLTIVIPHPFFFRSVYVSIYPSVYLSIYSSVFFLWDFLLAAGADNFASTSDSGSTVTPSTTVLTIHVDTKPELNCHVIRHRRWISAAQFLRSRTSRSRSNPHQNIVNPRYHLAFPQQDQPSSCSHFCSKVVSQCV